MGAIPEAFKELHLAWMDAGMAGGLRRQQESEIKSKMQIFKPKAFYWLPLNLVPKHAAVPDYLVGAQAFEHK